MVQNELTLIKAHEGFSDSPIFGYKEDYSQYVPGATTTATRP